MQPERPSIHVWQDNETEIDLLGFDVHADLIRSVITDPTVLPVTVGVFGDWGGGKSSIMKMLQDRRRQGDQWAYRRRRLGHRPEPNCWPCDAFQYRSLQHCAFAQVCRSLVPSRHRSSFRCDWKEDFEACETDTKRPC